MKALYKYAEIETAPRMCLGNDLSGLIEVQRFSERNR